MRKVRMLFVLLLVNSSFSQAYYNDAKQVGRVKAEQPTVFLEYVCQDKDKVYLRMHNNTTWHIDITLDEPCLSKQPITLKNGIKTHAAPNDKEIALRYQVDKFAMPWENVRVPKIANQDNGSSAWIASQGSVLFSVPVKYLTEGLQVFVSFHYEWEITAQGYTINDPEHRVSFRGLDLSKTKRVACGRS